MKVQGAGVVAGLVIVLGLFVPIGATSERTRSEQSGAAGSHSWGCRSAATAGDEVDTDLAAFIGTLRAVDNHSHANTVGEEDAESDALPLELIFPFEVPAGLRPGSSKWLAAYRGIYAYPHSDLGEAHRAGLDESIRKVHQEQGDRFPEWVLDKVGTDVMLANRIAMGPGLTSRRFRWVSFVDALMLPIPTQRLTTESPDRAKLFPMEEKLLTRYRDARGLARLPPSLDTYIETLVTPTLEAQKQAGAVAVKFEAAFLRSLDFGDVSAAAAGGVYARYASGGDPSPTEYKQLQDYLFRRIAREAGRLGLVVHIHSLEGPGNFYRASGADPLLLESVFNDPMLRETRFVIVHGGGGFAQRAGMLLWKPNVYVDMSGLALIYPTSKLAEILGDWLSTYPEKVLYGSDAAAFGPEMGWELAAWIASHNSRQALAMALTNMMRSGDLDCARARDIATMVMRTNAARLYSLELH